MELLSGLVGALIGGSFALIGSWLQSSQQMKALREQFSHERELAAKEHERRQTVVENERARARIDAQLRHGRLVTTAMSFYKSRVRPGATDDEARTARDEANRRAGFDPSVQAPFQDFLGDVEVDDDEFRDLLKRHHDLVLEVDVALLAGNVEHARETDWPKIGEIGELARRIDARFRVLQREGKSV